MCDTMIALGNSTRDGSILFAKNSDRQPNEPHIMIRIPRQKHQINNSPVKATYIQLPQVSETFEVMLLKPFWIWGCEMGCNEFGLNIGNEAVFTKEKYGQTGLTGMDMARIALERCRTSEEAVGMITGLLQTYGQGGNCGYEKSLVYHNSFLIADKQSAWVLETAGQYWAAKKVKDIYCISNCLTIEADFDKCHPDLIRHAIDKGWCRNEKDFSFCKCYGSHLFTSLIGAYQRLNTCRAMLVQEKGNITVDTMKRVLRAHDITEGQQFSRSTGKSVCMHSGGLLDTHTTGSYIASLQENLCTYWVTGASTPCISVYKPVWLVKNTPLFSEHDQRAAVDYWGVRERLHRMVMADMVDLDWYFQERNRFEHSFDRICQEFDLEKITEEKLAEISQEAFVNEAQLISKVVEQAERSEKQPRLRGNWYFKYYWKKQNQKLNAHFNWKN